MSRNYTATMTAVLDTLRILADNQAAMTAVLGTVARSQERIVDLLTTTGKPVSTVASPATTPAAPKAGKAATSGETGKAAKPVFTSYVRNGDLCVGLLCPSDVDLDDVLSSGARDAVHAKMLEVAREAHVWADDAGRLSQFRKAPKAQRRDGYAAMRIGRTNGDAALEQRMVKAAENVLCPKVTKAGK